MAATVFYLKSFLLLLFNLISSDALERRFSDIKRCADEECSMLLCRGKAVRDFSGPDCRFLSFKKSETIYVYYKLSGQRTDMWAGSVGSRFGYFQKDLLTVNHIYTDKELEVKAEETDFVCFDTGYDKFDNYDIDSLLDFSSLMGKNDDDDDDDDDEEDTDTIDETEIAQDTSDEAELSTEEATETESHEDHDDPQDFDMVPGDSLPQLDETTESLATEAVESDAETEPAAAEIVVEEREQLTTGDLALESDHSEQQSGTKDTPTKPEDEPLSKDHADSENETDSFSEGKPVPDLKTSLGETFDAVTTDDEDTWKVTPYEEEESEELEDRSDDLDSETLLLAFSEKKAADTPESDPLNEDQSPPATRGNDQQASEDKNIWTSFGDKVFAIVSGGERTADVSSSEEDEDDEGIVLEDDEDDEGIVSEDDEEGIVSEDDEEGIVSENPQSTEEPKAEEAQVLADEPSKEPEASEKSVIDDDDGDDVAGGGNGQDQTSTLPTDNQSSYEKTEEGTAAQKLVSRDDSPVVPQLYRLESKTLDKPTEEQASKVSELQDDNAHGHGKNTLDHHREESMSNSGEHKMTHSHQELPVEKIIPKKDPPHEEEKSKEFKGHAEQNDNTNTFKQFLKHSITGIEKSKRKYSHQELPVEEAELNEHTFEAEDEEEGEVETETGEEREELLEDENAILSTHTETDIPSLETSHPSTSEPEYSDSVLRLTLLREHFKEENMERLQRVLGLKNLFKAEAMFSDLDMELKAARHSQIGAEDVEKSLEVILEASETPIMDEIEKMLDGRDPKNADLHQMDTNMFDEEAAILDDLQELAFSLRQKYSTASDSAPLAADSPSHIKQDEHVSDDDDDDEEGVVYDGSLTEGTERDVNLTAAGVEEKKPPEREEEPSVLGEVHKRPDISLEEDGGHFNRNKDNQPSFPAADKMQKVPQAILEKPFDVGLGVDMEHSSSGSLDSMEPVSDLHEEEEWGLLSSGMFYTVCLLLMIKTKIGEWAILMISLLPDEYKPGETFFGCPWQAVVVTAFVGVITFILFFWRTVLAVKKREYLVDENGLSAQMKALMKEKNDAISKTSELQKQTEILKEKQTSSEETTTCALQRNQDLESKVFEAEARNQQIAEEKSSYVRLFEEERANSLKNGNRIEKLEKSNEKLLLSRKKTQEALSKTTVLLDEAKIREDARNVQRKCFERDHAALKEDNKALKTAIKDWEDKHKELSEQIKVYQKSQKELEDTVILKDNNVEVLSDLLADLDACDLQKSETRVLANGDVADVDKKTFIKNRIKQMMDVSRVQTTLAVVEEERDRFMNKLLNEEKARKTLEEQHQDLEHAIGTLKSERNHVDNQFTILKQKNEIMTEMYQQKENALQQRLTKEELERRSKETMLSEVGGKAVEAEEQVKVLRQRINEMEEQMKKTEGVYKEQIREQETKTHSNWVNARNAERALNQEKGETSKLREKLAVITSQLNERRAPLFRPNSGQPLAPRQGDSYGPSPVSGGAPSPPPMMEGPRRPPSAPVGRRIDPYGGPRPPSDPHGRYPDNKHNSGLDMIAPPRTSSPSQMDGMTAPVDTEAETQAEASTESPEPGPGSFLASPIRDSPGPMVHGPPTGPGPNDPLPHPGSHGRLPPPGPHRPVRPLYHPPGPLPPSLPHPHGHPLPANGHLGMLPPGPMGGEQFVPRPPNGHAFRPRPGPGMDLRGPPPPHFRPPPPHLYGPMHLPPGVRGPMGLRPPFPPDMRFPGPRDHAYPPHHLPPGAIPPLNSSVPHPGVGQRQDFPMQQEAAVAPQDSVNPAMAEP